MAITLTRIQQIHQAMEDSNRRCEDAIRILEQRQMRPAAMTNADLCNMIEIVRQAVIMLGSSVALMETAHREELNTRT